MTVCTGAVGALPRCMKKYPAPNPARTRAAPPSSNGIRLRDSLGAETDESLPESSIPLLMKAGVTDCFRSESETASRTGGTVSSSEGGS